MSGELAPGLMQRALRRRQPRDVPELRRLEMEGFADKVGGGIRPDQVAFVEYRADPLHDAVAQDTVTLPLSLR